VSIIYLLNLNYFIQIGGIEAIGEYTKDLNTINGLLPSMNIFNNLSDFVDEEYYQKKVLPYLLNALKSLPNSLNEEEIKQAKKEDINSLFYVLKVIIIL